MKGLAAAIAVVVVLAVISLFIGVSDVSLSTLFGTEATDRAAEVMLVSRIPRTLAIILAGMSMAVSGMIMQMLTRNRFVEPSTAGTVESASLGILLVILFAPETPVIGKMLVASVTALAGTALFLRILRAIAIRSCRALGRHHAWWCCQRNHYFHCLPL